MNFCVLTTIFKPTKAIEELYDRFGTGLIIVGDKKTPQEWFYNGVVPIRESNKLYAPDNHYARKNLGYLVAIKNKADLIYDTDDDNIPNENWKTRTLNNKVRESKTDGWVNVYFHFLGSGIWPRGFSLKHIQKVLVWSESCNIDSSVQQGVSDGEPDVDAIWRMVFGNKVKFEKRSSVFLPKHSWCSFNSQSTWWFPKAYPLMYLPVYATFRMTDIWRSFVAQRCLWEIGEGVTFHSPSEVFQDRNEHDLMKDFEDEVPGYLKNDKIVELLGNLKLKQGEENTCDNLLKCYEELVINNILPIDELFSVKQWIKDYEVSKFLL
jgi:hypothetical protein